MTLSNDRHGSVNVSSFRANREWNYYQFETGSITVVDVSIKEAVKKQYYTMVSVESLHFRVVGK